MKRNHVFSVRNLVMMAALTAMSIILSRYLGIQVSENLRISFESVPIILAGMWLGPISGMVVAFLADIIGTVLSGYGAWFAPITVGPMLVGLISGLSTRYVFRSDLTAVKDTWKVFATVIVAGIINSLLVGSLTTTLYQMIVVGREDAFGVLLTANFLQRIATKPFVIAVDAVLVFLVNKAVYKPVIRQIVSRA